MILVVGVDHQTASLQLREKLAFDTTQIKEVNRELIESSCIEEVVTISTCNRTEIYTAVTDMKAGERLVRKALYLSAAVHDPDMTHALFVKKEDHAVEHAMRVASGLNSLVIGETQILGQMKQAFFESQKEKHTGKVLNKLFNEAIKVGKAVQSKTKIGASAVSVSSAAVQLVKERIGSLNGMNALVIGAGETGTLAAKHLHAHDTEVAIVNRTYEKAKKVADTVHGEAAPFSEYPRLMEKADIVACAIDGQRNILTKKVVEKSRQGREERPFIFIDLGVPRNIDPAVKTIPNVHLFTIDNIKDSIDDHIQLRKIEAKKAKKMIEEAVREFKEWAQLQNLTPVLKEMTSKAEDIHTEAWRNINNKLPELTAREKKVIEKYTHMIISQMNLQPMEVMKTIVSKSKEEEQAAYIQLFRHLYGDKEDLHEVNVRSTTKKLSTYL